MDTSHPRMKSLLALAQREWLQHRLGWTLMLAIPLGLAALLAAFGSVQVDVGDMPGLGPDMLPLLALGALVITPGLLLFIAWIASASLMAALARRDHADRSIEFWLSLPTSHAASLGVPLAAHLLLVPAAALLVGALAALPLSALLVARFGDAGAWFALPWGRLLAAEGALLARLLFGLPLATLWLLPLLLLVVLFGAWFRRWGFAILTMALGLGGVVLDRVLGHPVVMPTITVLVKNAAWAMFGPEGLRTRLAHGHSPMVAIDGLREHALASFGPAIAGLATWPFVAALAASALLFYALVQWRSRGAGGGA